MAPGPRPTRRIWLAWLAAILAITFVVYIPSLDNEFTNWDDNGYVTANPVLANPSVREVLTVPVGGNYHPLTIWSLALNYRISGLDPISYHWLNLTLHILNTALVFFLIRSLTRGWLWTTVITAMFFGIHPMHVESVAWISARKDVLYACFYLLGLIAYLKYVDTKRRAWFGAVATAFVLSVASKPAALVFPVSLLAIDYYRRRPFSRGLVLEKLPLFAVSVVGGILTLKAQQVAGGMPEAQVWGVFEKLLLASYALVAYVGKLLYPVSLSIIYPYPGAVTGRLDLEFYVAFIAVAIVLPTIVYLSHKIYPVMFGIGFFMINIVLVLPFITFGNAIIADRYTYLPYVGLFVAIGWVLDERSGSAASHAGVRVLVAASMSLLGLLSIGLTWNRCEVWQDSETLMSDAIEKNPRGFWKAYLPRGTRYIEVGRWDGALTDLNQALALNPRSPEAWMNKGLVLFTLDRIDSALVCTNRAIELRPRFPVALANRGGIRVRRGEVREAIVDLSLAIELDPGHRRAYMNRAIAHSRMGEELKGIADRRRAIELSPRDAGNYRLLGSIGLALQRIGRHREAIGALDEAIRAAPDADPRRGAYYLARSHAWLALGDKGRSLTDSNEAKRLGIESGTTDSTIEGG